MFVSQYIKFADFRERILIGLMMLIDVVFHFTDIRLLDCKHAC